MDESPASRPVEFIHRARKFLRFCRKAAGENAAAPATQSAVIDLFTRTLCNATPAPPPHRFAAAATAATAASDDDDHDHDHDHDHDDDYAGNALPYFCALDRARLISFSSRRIPPSPRPLTRH
jgi:hypothetical protein